MFFFRQKEPVAWIVVFLGNPGLRYENTRHNAGFMTADVIERELGIKINRSKFDALTAVATLGGKRVLLLKPQTYMNLSGNAVRQAMRFYKLEHNKIIVVSDEVSLPTGALRIRRSGSAGGHNGLKDIIAKAGGENFARVRIGVGAPPSSEFEMVDWVLSRLEGDDLELVQGAVLKAAAAIELILMDGIDAAMRKYN